MATLSFNLKGELVTGPFVINGTIFAIQENHPAILSEGLVLHDGYGSYRDIKVSIQGFPESGIYFPYWVWQLKWKDKSHCGLIYWPYKNVLRQIAREHGVPEEWSVEEYRGTLLNCSHYGKHNGQHHWLDAYYNGGGFKIDLTPYEERLANNIIVPSRSLVYLLTRRLDDNAWGDKILANYE